MMSERLVGNVWRLYAIGGILWFLVLAPILVLFYQQKGLSMHEVLVVRAYSSMLYGLMVVPAGYVADAIAKRFSIVSGVSLAFLGFLGYSVADSFWSFVAAQTFVAAGAAFLAGANSALLYDTLLSLGREADYSRSEGRMLAFCLVAEGLASIVGGLLAQRSLHLPVLVQPAIAFLALPLALTLVEPPRARVASTITLRELGATAREIFRRVPLRLLILYGASITAASDTVMWFLQPMLRTLGMDVFHIGVIWAVLHLAAAGLSMKAHAVHDVLGSRRTKRFFFVVVVFGFLAAGLLSGWPSFLCAAAVFANHGLATPFFKARVNDIVDSRIRATALALMSLVHFALFSFAGPAVGAIADHRSMREAFVAAGAFFLLLNVVGCVLAHRGLASSRDTQTNAKIVHL